MIVLGIDPGSIKLGYAVIEVQNRLSWKVLSWGGWDLKKEAPDSWGDRSEILFAKLKSLLEQYNPHLIGFEKAVSFKSVPAALTLSEARGVIRFTIHHSLDQANQRIVELSPTQVKKACTGNGRATKENMMKILKLRTKSFPDLKNSSSAMHDAYDALAIAWAASIVHNSYRHGIKHRTAARAES